MCTHFEGEAPTYLSSLNGQLPHRSRFLESAFAAHARRDYAASVPLFLAQADGICHELTGKQLYRRVKGKPQLAAALAGWDEEFIIGSLIGPLTEPTILTATPTERAAASDDVLNRHVVLHGESTAYDTRRNSCRAMSLLVYVAWVLEHPPVRP